jgi:hypothetical protein
MDVRTAENYRESWFITNDSNNKITIGDLLLLPAISPNETIDALQYYTKEKIGHSIVLTDLVKSGIVSFSKEKIYDNDLPGPISSDEIDEAITSAEENELINQVSEGEEITDDTDGILLFGKDPDDEAQPIGISGEETNEVLTVDIDVATVLEEIYVELIKANIQMAIITGNEIKNKEIHVTTQDN